MSRGSTFSLPSRSLSQTSAWSGWWTATVGGACTRDYPKIHYIRLPVRGFPEKEEGAAATKNTQTHSQQNAGSLVHVKHGWVIAHALVRQSIPSHLAFNGAPSIVEKGTDRGGTAAGVDVWLTRVPGSPCFSRQLFSAPNKPDDRLACVGSRSPSLRHTLAGASIEEYKEGREGKKCRFLLWDVGQKNWGEEKRAGRVPGPKYFPSKRDAGLVCFSSTIALYGPGCVSLFLCPFSYGELKNWLRVRTCAVLRGVAGVQARMLLTCEHRTRAGWGEAQKRAGNPRVHPGELGIREGRVFRWVFSNVFPALVFRSFILFAELKKTCPGFIYLNAWVKHALIETWMTEKRRFGGWLGERFFDFL